jgi:hypothetical protein
MAVKVSPKMPCDVAVCGKGRKGNDGEPSESGEAQIGAQAARKLDVHRQFDVAKHDIGVDGVDDVKGGLRGRHNGDARPVALKKALGCLAGSHRSLDQEDCDASEGQQNLRSRSSHRLATHVPLNAAMGSRRVVACITRSVECRSARRHTAAPS